MEANNDTESQNHAQCLKSRDDQGPVRFRPTADGQFILSDSAACSWVKSDGSFDTGTLRSRVEPWLTALVQSEHLSLLIGSGLTHAVHGIARKEKLPGMTLPTFTHFGKAIEAEAKRFSEAASREDGNFEDRIRASGELLRGLEILQLEDANGSYEQEKIIGLQKEVADAIQSFASSILEGEQNLVAAPNEKREQAVNYLVSFLMSFASRSGTRDRLHIFTTNYDRFIELGAEVAGLRLIDRFVGSVFPIFRSSRLDVDLHYNPPGIRGEPRYLEGVARFFKLHGSVDWLDCEESIRRIGLPFGAREIDACLSASGTSDADALRLMIFPNAAKDRETALYPYVELFRDFAAATCRPNSTLVCYGYSFGDEHINRVIEDMLTIPSAHLVVIAYDDPLGRIMKTYEKLGRQAQITLLIGDHLGDLKNLVDHYLPKPAIDRTTFRMAELLRARMTTDSRDDTAGDARAVYQGPES